MTNAPYNPFITKENNMEISSTTATVISVIISAIISIISITINWKALKATKEQNMEINNAQIDAQLVWSTQIDKIQKIRQSTAEFISACNNYIHFSGSLSEKQEMLQLANEKFQLFILYFEPDIDINEDNEQKTTDLRNQTTNIGKSNEIVKLASDILFWLPAYPSLKENLDKCNKSYVKCYLCLYRNQKQDCPKANSYDNDIPFSTCECKEALCNFSKKSCDIQKVIHYRYKEQLDLLTEVIRIYLKVEMNQVRVHKAVPSRTAFPDDTTLL